MDKQFIGEHLLPGQTGHLFVITAFVTALLSAFSYWNAVKTETQLNKSHFAWLMLGRFGFLFHSFSILTVFGVLYYIIQNHLFEYHYAWEHSSLDLPPKYLLSCFWEGQQGSFMLWMFWHCVLGIIAMTTSKTLETRTMFVIAVVQVLLCSMLLGFYFGPDFRLGSTPFDLMRNAMQNAPIFSMPNYLKFLKDGNGLNVLLQNYWMVIHPPVLFLGFALTLMPFAYCIAALWKQDYENFIQPTLVWSLLNGAVLGTGIMMGGAWAYESLNFGGYWAWDPVENASLVPWLTLIAGLHTLISFKHTGRALAATFVLLLLTHLLVWYSTFLTRTGILGTTSVHAFTGDGQSLLYHLLVVMGILLLPAVALLAFRWKRLPSNKTEEATFTREFWLFVGSVILLLSACQIILSTSIPVWAPLYKFFTGKDIAPPVDAVGHYNNIQVWIAIVIGLITGFALFLKYKQTNLSTLLKMLLVPTIISVVMAALIAYFQDITKFQYVLMLFAACFGMTANLFYFVTALKGKISKSGPSVAHFGFAMVLAGILISSYGKHVISANNTGNFMSFGKKTDEENLKENLENVTLYRNRPTQLGEYEATYIGDSAVSGKDLRVYYLVRFLRKDTLKHTVSESFTLFPDAFINPKGMKGLSANPSTKHYWNRDIFTFINATSGRTDADTAHFKDNVVQKEGDTISLKGGYMVYNGIVRNIEHRNITLQENDLGVEASLSIYDLNGKVKDLHPAFVVRNRQYEEYTDDSLSSLDLSVRLGLRVESTDKVTVNILTKQGAGASSYIVLKAIVFPYINVLWLGVILMVLGFFISIFHKLRIGK
jgi:cytochrome c-type biogenesis protein CcmF